MHEPRIAIAASPREWWQRLHRHVADHGGALVRATILHAEEALTEAYDVLVADDTTSFLTHRLVEELHEQGRALLGVYDSDDPHGKGELLELGADDVVARDADPQTFISALANLAAHTTRPQEAHADDPDDGLVDAEPGAPGHLTVVGGPSGGCGATEVAIGLAAAAAGRGEVAGLVDADDVAPALAQRLGLAPYPNLRAAIDAVEHRTGRLVDALQLAPGGRFAVLAGLPPTADWSQVRPLETLAVLSRLARAGRHVIVNIGHRLEDVQGLAGPGRYAQTRQVLGAADAVVVVGAPTPVGVSRIVTWAGQAAALAPDAPLHLALNRAPSSPFRRREIAEELRHSVAAHSLSFLPADPRVDAAAWSGALPAKGPFVRAVGELADAVLPVLTPARQGRRRAG